MDDSTRHILVNDPVVSLGETENNQKDENILLPYLPSGPSHPDQMDMSISRLKGFWYTFSFLFIPVSKQCRP